MNLSKDPRREELMKAVTVGLGLLAGAMSVLSVQAKRVADAFQVLAEQWEKDETPPTEPPPPPGPDYPTGATGPTGPPVNP